MLLFLLIPVFPQYDMGSAGRISGKFLTTNGTNGEPVAACRTRCRHARLDPASIGGGAVRGVCVFFCIFFPKKAPKTQYRTQ
jgi:hypothetical protein